MSESHDATFYIQVQPEFSHYPDRTGKWPVRALKAINVTQKAPSRPRSGTVLVKLTLRIPDAAFYPLRPEAVIVVPEDMVQISPVIDVEVADPDAAPSPS